jgi:hypothetical protein
MLGKILEVEPHDFIPYADARWNPAICAAWDAVFAVAARPFLSESDYRRLTKPWRIAFGEVAGETTAP